MYCFMLSCLLKGIFVLIIGFDNSVEERWNFE